MVDAAIIRQEARKELARRVFYDYCQLKYPKHYTDDRVYLKDLCHRVQAFGEQNKKRFLVINVPPRHYKSFTAGNFVEWRFGEDPSQKVMTASYNEILSTTFARKVRDTIDETPSDGVLVYRDIFPNTRVKYGQASASKWALEDSHQDNYLATSPTGTATGFGANCLAGDTLISTTGGTIRLDALAQSKSPHQILTYNHKRRMIETESVVASKRTNNQVVYEIETADGTKIRATKNHRFYIEGHGYKTVSWILRRLRAAKSGTRQALPFMLRSIERQERQVHLPTLRHAVYPPQIRDRKDTGQRARGEVLLKDVPTQIECRGATEALLSLWRGGAEDERHLLFGHLQGASFSWAKASRHHLWRLWSTIQAAVTSNQVLFPYLRSQEPLVAYASSEGWLRTDLPHTVQEDTPVGIRTGHKLPQVPVGLSSERPSHQRAQVGQSDDKPSHTMSSLPYINTRIISVRRCADRTSVYDIQTERNHNFFANGLLTHNCIIIDDIIKNAEEAYSELVLEKHWSWFTNTALSRTEGDDWKVYVFMTRWAQGDLAGRIIDAFPDEVEVITYKAVQDDGSMLCDAVLNRKDYELKTQEMNPDIVEANYNQQPIDVKGRLYTDFPIWEDLPAGQHKKWNYTDTADTGADFLCSVDYIEHEGDVYVTDVVMTDEAMEETEPAVAAMLNDDDVHEAIIESNNGGRGFARNIERLLVETHGNKRCVVRWQAQTSNKEARILTSSAWVSKHVFMPYNWKHKYPEFYKQLMSYQKKGKNKHDDAVDVLAGIYEEASKPDQSKFAPSTGGEYSSIYPQKQRVVLRSRYKRQQR